MTAAIQSGTPTAREATTDVLKFLFNILMHYPKVCTTAFAQVIHPNPKIR